MVWLAASQGRGQQGPGHGDVQIFPRPHPGLAMMQVGLLHTTFPYSLFNCTHS